MNKALAHLPSPIRIDGSQGEGGGQILRTALSLSMITGKPFELVNLRAGRKKPGLMRQHLVCVQASQQISHAYTEGAGLHSQYLYFAPQHIQAGHYEFQIGSAGSSLLVFQTLLPVLLQQSAPSQLIIHGGTHNPMAPTADFIQHSFIPTLAKIGIQIDFEMEKAGFFPIGAGKIKATIHPWQQRQELDLRSRGKLQATCAYAAVLNLDASIAARELATLQKKLNLQHTQQLTLQGISQGNSVFVCVESEQHHQVFSALGELRKSAEQIAGQLAKEVNHYLHSQAVADEYLADQLLLPLALGQGGRFSAQTISEHTRTQVEMIKRFLDCEIELIEHAEQHVEIIVSV